MLAQDFLIVVGTVLAAAIRVMDAALRWSPQRNGHVQRPDRKVPQVRLGYSSRIPQQSEVSSNWSDGIQICDEDEV